MYKAATSLLLILVVAFGARLVFAWDQMRKIPAAALAGVWRQSPPVAIGGEVTLATPGVSLVDDVAAGVVTLRWQHARAQSGSSVTSGSDGTAPRSAPGRRRAGHAGATDKTGNPRKNGGQRIANPVAHLARSRGLGFIA